MLRRGFLFRTQDLSYVDYVIFSTLNSRERSVVAFSPEREGKQDKEHSSKYVCGGGRLTLWSDLAKQTAHGLDDRTESRCALVRLLPRFVPPCLKTENTPPDFYKTPQPPLNYWGLLLWVFPVRFLCVCSYGCCNEG